jgi:hypothetical protein
MNQKKGSDSHTKAHNDQGIGESSRSTFMLKSTRQRWRDQDIMTDETPEAKKSIQAKTPVVCTVPISVQMYM